MIHDFVIVMCCKYLLKALMDTFLIVCHLLEQDFKLSYVFVSV